MEKPFKRAFDVLEKYYDNVSFSLLDKYNVNTQSELPTTEIAYLNGISDAIKQINSGLHYKL